MRRDHKQGDVLLKLFNLGHIFAGTIVVGALVVQTAIAAKNSETIPLTHQCIAAAADQYNIHPDILYAILIVEGGSVGQSSRNTNSTSDHNLFQVNDANVPFLISRGFTLDEILNDGCKSAAMAALLVETRLQERPLSPDFTQMDYLRSIARYHSKTPAHNEVYAMKLYDAFQLIYEGRTER